jgi:hypothetical protein
MAVKLPSGTRSALRTVAPWIAAALALQVGLGVVWLHQTKTIRSDMSRAHDLRDVVPSPTALQARIDSLVADSIALSTHLASARGRTIESSDPAAELASRLVPLLGAQGWKLQRVRAESKEGWAILDLGAESDFGRILSGMRLIRTQPTALQVRRFSIRPAGPGRLGIDLQVASPARTAR